MKNKKKKLVSLALIGSLSLVSVFSLSATPTQAQTESGQNTPKDPQKQKRDVSVAFDQFAGVVSEGLKDAFGKAVFATIGKLKDEKAKIQKIETDAYKKITKTAYIQNIINFLEKNKKEIEQNYSKFGFHTVFLNALSTLKELNWGSVTVEEEKDGKKETKTYEQIVFGEQSDSKNSYVGKIGPNGKVTSTEKIKNIKLLDEIKDTTKKYSEKLINDLYSIIYNEKDAPEISEEDLLKFDEKDSNAAIVFKVPKGFKDWEEYIRSKYSSRFIKFDLEQNRFEDEEQQTPPPPPKPTLPELPKPLPLVPNDPDEGKIEDSNTVNQQSLSILSPIIKDSYLKDIPALIKNFNVDKKSENYFFFNNPVNTRFLYEVTQIHDQGQGPNNSLDQQSQTQGKIRVTVKVSDRNIPESTREYLADVDLPSPIVDISFREKFNHLYEKQIDEVKDVFVSLYKSVGLDDTMKFINLGEGHLIAALLAFNRLGTQIVYGLDFSKLQEEILNKYATGILTKGSVRRSNLEIRRLILSALSASKFTVEGTSTKISPFASIPSAFESVIDKFRQTFKNDIDFDKIKQKFKEANMDIKVLDQLFNKLIKDVFQLQSIANNPNFDIFTWYESYINKTEKITQQIKHLSALTYIGQDTKDPKNPEEDTKTKALKAYNESKVLLNEEKSTQKNVQFILGIILEVVGTLALLGTWISTFTKKNLKKKKTLIILITLISITLIVAGLPLIFLSL
ncbi:MSC_0620 family F1-like ATPase-associated subunit [Mycoplasmopsis pulmonis]|nr:hypothetical protein [Mycoplasmopsis pulmonis]